MQNWKTCRNILCIRADNMGDVIMCGPAMRALKKFTNAKITLLSSRQGSVIAPYLPEIDDVIAFNAPWVKTDDPASAENIFQLIGELKSRAFDAVVIFSVYSQSALPAALVCQMAGIPRRLAYCRENPYDLLTDWLPDEEPYRKILHQVKRDLRLVESIGAHADHDQLQLLIGEGARLSMWRKVSAACGTRNFVVLHAGVSEKKREYPINYWSTLAGMIARRFKAAVLLTGSATENELAANIVNHAGAGVFNTAGLFSIEEFICLIQQARLVVTVNTSTVHIAAAVQTPQIVLYAQTNPQHTPWKSPAKVMPFKVSEDMKSKNEVVRYVSEYCINAVKALPLPPDILTAAESILSETPSVVQKIQSP